MDHLYFKEIVPIFKIIAGMVYQFKINIRGIVAENIIIWNQYVSCSVNTSYV